MGCTEEESVRMPIVDISFSPAIISNTRATQGTYPTDAPFEVWAYYLPKSKRWSDNCSEAQQLTAGHKVEYNGSEWLPTPALAWPSDNNVTFIASAPLNIDTDFSIEDGIIIKDFDVMSGVLPLFTEPVADCDAYNTNGYIALPFIHALSKVEFEVRSVILSDSVIKLKSLYMDNIMYKGNFNSLPEPTWEPYGETMRVDFCNDEIVVGRISTSVGWKMIMGQYINNKVVLIVDILDSEGNTLVHDRKIELSLIVDRWQAGKYYKYTLNLTTDSASFETEVFERFNI